MNYVESVAALLLSVLQDCVLELLGKEGGDLVMDLGADIAEGAGIEDAVRL